MGRALGPESIRDWTLVRGALVRWTLVRWALMGYGVLSSRLADRRIVIPALPRVADVARAVAQPETRNSKPETRPRYAATVDRGVTDSPESAFDR